MSRIATIDPDVADNGLRQQFDAIHKQLGMVPNLMRTMAQSPSALSAYLAFGSALRGGTLHAALQEQIALAVAEINTCDYCLSAHSALGRRVGLTEEQLLQSRDGRDADPSVAAALQFARAILDRRGDVSDQDIARVRAAGFSEAAIVEIIAQVALNVFTNYFNRAAQTDIDFPQVTAAQHA
jgi:uncharacterized peroxidase-related enzyme